jgi:hypothetical protein
METGSPHSDMGICESLLGWVGAKAGQEILVSWPKFLVVHRRTRDSGEGKNTNPRNHTGSPRARTGKETKKFPYGQSPFLKRVCDHMGSNTYTHLITTFGQRRFCRRLNIPFHICPALRLQPQFLQQTSSSIGKG